MKNKPVSAISLILFLFLFYATGWSQEPGSIYDTVYSDILKEKRPIQINLPASYKPDSSARYDVLYVLDGEWNTSLAKTVRGFLEYGKFIPANIIIVGIPNLYRGNDNFRDRDFTPTPLNFSPMSGGAANFLSFIKNDLLPYMDKKYPTNKENNTLYGTSLGGLFALYAFFQEPSLFKSYLTVEPSLWWDDGYLNKLAIEKIGSLSNVQGTLWISSRNGAAYHQMGIAPLDSILQQNAPKNLDWKVETYPNETHFTAIWKGIYDGYKFSYRGMMPEGDFALDPMNGRLVKGKSFSLYCFNMDSENYIHYTTDGSEPTNTSQTLKPENHFSFSESTIVTIKSIGARKENDKTIRCQFIIDEKPMAAMAKPKKAKEGGLNYKYYKGDWNQLPDLSKIKPTAKGVAGKDFNVNKLDTQNGFACLLEGFIEVPKEGYYKVEVNGDHSCHVWVGQQLVIGNPAAQTTRENFMIYLQQGLYPYKVAYLYKKGDHPFSPVSWYQQNEENISPAMLTFFYDGK
jgi:predicted alpha/beta superfamily hydrolase